MFRNYDESSDKLLSLSDCTDSRMNPRFSLFSRIYNPCNRFIIGVIRDFWTFQKSYELKASAKRANSWIVRVSGLLWGRFRSSQFSSADPLEGEDRHVSTVDQSLSAITKTTLNHLLKPALLF
jgi:hypothetical protein